MQKVSCYNSHLFFHGYNDIMKVVYDIAEIAPYINWTYFFHAWGMQGKPGEARESLRQEALAVLRSLEGRYRAYGLFRLLEANADGDDVVVRPQGVRLPFLRQQQADSSYLCLADFVRPLSSGIPDRIGVFATSVSHGLETDFDADPYQKMMVQLLADRLAEAAAERLHEQVRKSFWGYAPEERLSVSEMLLEHFQGIRPAVGYPALPDTSLNFLLDDLLDMSQIGIRLTESGAMKPHASVSGLMIALPEARYFSVGKIGRDQLCDYARRRGLPVEVCRRFLAGNL